MKLSIHSVLLLFILIPTLAQPPVEPIGMYGGPDLNLANDLIIPGIFGHDETGYFTHTLDYRDGVGFLDTEFRSVISEDLDLMNGLRNRILLGLFHFHDSIYMFTSEERVTRKMLFVETIDKETMLQNRDERKLMDIHNMAGWVTEFGFGLSREENKLLVYSRLDALTRHFQDIHFEMYAEGMTLEWEADQRIAYPKRPPRAERIKVNEEGDVFIITLQDEQRLSSLWNITKNRYRLFAITENGKYNNSYMLDYPGLYIRGIHLEPGADHIVSLVGFYSPTHYRAMVDGVFYVELNNESGEFLNKRFFEFEPWFLAEAMAPNPKKPPEEMFWFIIRHMIRRNNGDFLVLAENEYDQSYDTYLNIIAMNFSPGGTLNWKRVIPKRQGIDDQSFLNQSSFQVHAPVNIDKAFIVFNDNIRNGEWPDEEKIKSFHPNSKATLKVVSIGASGEISSSIIYRKTKKRMKTPVPLQYYDLLNHEMVIPSIRWKKYNYLKISFNE